MTLQHASFARARTIDEACRLLTDRAAEKPMLLAGGTDLVVEGHLAEPTALAPEPRLLIDVSSVTELQDFSERGEVGGVHTIRIGGGVTYLMLRREPRLSSRLPLLALMAKDVGAVQIQARGTLAGNLATASPAADGVAALAALDAVIVLRSTRGERTVPIGDFYTGYKKTERRPDELIAAVDVRVPSASARWVWRKVGTRLAQAISKVALAAVVEVDAQGTVTHARFGMASVAATTALLSGVRKALEGQNVANLDIEQVVAALDADISPIDDVRSTGEYRMHVARALVRQFVLRLDGKPSVPPPPTSVRPR